MSDLVSRVLTAIGQAERDLREKAGDASHQRWAMEESPDYNEGCIVSMALDGLRHCVADRDTAEWCAEVIGARDLSNYGQDGCLKDDPQSLAVTLAVETLKNLERGYGISVEEETTGEA